MPEPHARNEADEPELFRVILPVSDIHRAETFYSELLGMKGVRVSPGRHYFNCGGTILACFDPRADTDDFDLGPNPDHLYFAVSDLEEVLRRATKLRATILDPIAVRPWGERSFYVKDPFGNKVCFVDRSTLFLGEESLPAPKGEAFTGAPSGTGRRGRSPIGR